MNAGGGAGRNAIVAEPHVDVVKFDHPVGVYGEVELLVIHAMPQVASQLSLALIFI